MTNIWKMSAKKSKRTIKTCKSFNGQCTKTSGNENTELENQKEMILYRGIKNAVYGDDDL